VLSQGGSDLIMRLPETADHRKWNRQRAVDAIPIHYREHRFGALHAPAVESLAYMAVGIEYRESIAHFLLARPHNQQRRRRAERLRLIESIDTRPGNRYFFSCSRPRIDPFAASEENTALGYPCPLHLAP
jgi:hypothetical protein